VIVPSKSVKKMIFGSVLMYGSSVDPILTLRIEIWKLHRKMFATINEGEASIEIEKERKD
jgi:hypothetical protein